MTGYKGLKAFRVPGNSTKRLRYAPVQCLGPEFLWRPAEADGGHSPPPSARLDLGRLSQTTLLNTRALRLALAPKVLRTSKDNLGFGAHPTPAVDSSAARHFFDALCSLGPVCRLWASMPELDCLRLYGLGVRKGLMGFPDARSTLCWV